MKKIEIKSLFSDWHKVNKQTAINYTKFLINNITTMRGEKLINYIEKRYLRGIKVQELLEIQ